MRRRLGPIELHGWDARARTWHGPTTLHQSLKGCARIVARMRAATGSWYGRLQADLPGEPRLTFCACVHDLGDAALGVLDLEGTDGGPLHFVLVIPADRRGRLRPDLAFEFTSFVRFLGGPQLAGDELALHDHVETALHAASRATLVFSVETRVLLPELQILLAQQSERLIMSMIAALPANCEPCADAAD